MKQFGKILKFELKYYFKNRIFIGVTIALALLIAGVMFFPRISDTLRSEKDTGGDETRPVMLVQAGETVEPEAVQTAFAAAFSEYDVQSTDKSIEEIQNQITGGEAECAFVITGPTTYSYYANTLSLYDANTEIAGSVLQNLYRMHAMIADGMTPEKAEQVINVEIDSDVVTLGKNQFQNYFYTYIMIFALYMVILLYGQMVATNVASEKSSRAMELLITSARPASMMFGKVVASCLAGLVQLVAVFGSAFLFYNVNKSYWADNGIVQSIFNIPADLLVYMLIFFILGFFIYAFLYGAIGSTASKVEDINTSVMPLTFLFIIGFIVVITAISSGDVDNTAMMVCSYVPFTSPMAMFARIAMSSTVAWYEIVISIGILAGSVFGIGILCAKIYRVGVLLYGTTPKIGSILKAVWRA